MKSTTPPARLHLAVTSPRKRLVPPVCPANLEWGFALE